MIYTGEALTVLKTLPAESVNCVMTSPPYWSMRDYGVKGQLGLEPTIQEYINNLCDIFDEVKRVLRNDGTCWVNLGDTYNNSAPGSRNKARWPKQSRNDHQPKNRKILKTIGKKCLLQIPSRFAIEMCNRGWILRNELIWHKPNAMPESAKDRFTMDFEKIFFFVKNKKYWFEQQFEAIKLESIKRERRGNKENKYSKDQHLPPGVHANTMSQTRKYKGYDGIEEEFKNRKGRNMRCIWKISSTPCRKKHFAVFPKELCITPIQAGCPKGGIVLDMFTGAGTTGLVAANLGRKFIGIELNPEYVKIAEERIKAEK